MITPSKFISEISEQMSDLFLIMNQQSQFIYSNTYTVKLLGYKSIDHLVGDDATKIKCKAAEFAEQFFQQDKFVFKSQTKLKLLDIHEYADDETKVFLTSKTPFHTNDELAGIICQSAEIPIGIFFRVLTRLIDNTKKYVEKNSIERSFSIDKIINDDSLTKREMDCIFYLLHGKSLEEISNIFNISSITLGTHFNTIKHKWACDSNKKLIDHAIAHGYLSYIPNEILSDQSSIQLFLQ